MVLDDAGYELGKTYHLEGKTYCRERSREPAARGRRVRAARCLGATGAKLEVSSYSLAQAVVLGGAAAE